MRVERRFGQVTLTSGINDPGHLSNFSEKCHGGLALLTSRRFILPNIAMGSIIRTPYSIKMKFTSFVHVGR